MQAHRPIKPLRHPAGSLHSVGGLDFGPEPCPSCIQRYRDFAVGRSRLMASAASWLELFPNGSMRNFLANMSRKHKETPNEGSAPAKETFGCVARAKDAATKLL